MPGTQVEDGAIFFRNLGFRSGAWPRAVLLHVGVLALFGVSLPYAKGLAFFDPMILGAYATLGVIFSGPAVAQLFPEGETSKPYLRVAWAVLYGEVMIGLLLGLGILTVYLPRVGRMLYWPDLPSLGEMLVFGLVLSVALTALTAWFTLRFSAPLAKTALRAIFLSLVLTYYVRGRMLPVVVWPATALAGVAAAAALLLLRKRKSADA